MKTATTWTGWVALVTVPFVALALLWTHTLPDPAWYAFDIHFLVVTITSIIALLIALLMVVAAAQLKDARVVFLSLAFLGIAGIFSVHGLTTPGALVQGANPWIGLAANLALLVGAIFFALSTVGWGTAFERAIIRHQRTITITFSFALVLFAAVALGSSLTQHVSDEPVAEQVAEQGEYDAAGLGPLSFLTDEPIERGVVTLTLVLLGLVAWRYLTLYRIAHSPLVAGFLASAIFLFQGQVAMATTPVWHVSWWIYHGVLFMSFGAASAGMIVEYTRSRSLSGVVEGLLLRDAIGQLQRGYTEVIVALVRAVEAKDVYTRGHTQRVSALAVRIGQELRLPHERLRVLAQSAMLHDIGKIGVPDSILNKPGPLTAEEFEVIKEHPVRGHMIIKDVRSLQAEIAGVRHHHERLDGTGYPDGLVGDEIPQDARIIAVADVYDALTSPRPYRAAWSQGRALALLREQAGCQLDADCVVALERVVQSQKAPAALDEAHDERVLVALSS